MAGAYGGHTSSQLTQIRNYVTSIAGFGIWVPTPVLTNLENAIVFSERQTQNVRKRQDLLAAEFDFALSLLSKLAADKSCIVSPLSISLALSLVHSGVKGTSRTEIEKLLLNGTANEEFSQHFSNLIGNISKVLEGVDFQLANRVFVKDDYPLLDSYLSSVRNNYKADGVSLDFNNRIGLAEAVNSFVNEVTHGKITEIVKEKMFDELLRLVLINAVYMKGEWACKFEKEETQTGKFYVSKRADNWIDYLTHNKVARFYYHTEQYQLLSLEYKDTRYRFNIFLPHQKFELEKLQTILTGDEIEEILNGRLRKQLVNLKMPKFKLESDINLVKILKDLGTKAIFVGGEDLSGFTGYDDLYVSDVIHKATIELDEEGSIATAATAVLMKARGLAREITPVNFIADHPFIFCITFNNHPVFMGKYY